MIRLVPRSLKVIVPLGLFGFAATLCALTLAYYVPLAERSVEQDKRERLFQDLSRLQSSLEYLLLKADIEGARREVAILAFNHDCNVAVLSDDAGTVVAATQRAWLTRPASEVMPMLDPAEASRATQGRGARIVLAGDGKTLRAYGEVRIGGDERELRSSRSGSLFLEYDLHRAKSMAVRQTVAQSLYWAAWVMGFALLLWIVFHFVLTRRVDRLARSAERIASGDFGARSGLSGRDEIGRLGQAFDAMAVEVDSTHERLTEDIAERSRTEGKLRASEASYRAVFDASEDAIMVFEIDSGAILDANAKACSTYGYSLEKMRSIDMTTLTAAARAYTHQDLMDQIARAAGGERLEFEWRRKGPDGEVHWDAVFFKRVTIGGRDRILGLARDITEAKRAARELSRQRELLHQSDKLAALGSMLAGVAHELNNPLSVVVARAVLLEEQGDPVTHPTAVKIRVAAERCARIVRTYLSMARRQPPVRRAVRIEDVVVAALEITGYSLRTGGIEVERDLADGGASVLADDDQLHQVFVNLIVNAHQALQETDPPRRLRLTSRLCAGGDVVWIAVEDNGPGIAEHLRSRIFEPYFTTKPDGVGTGVGLSVSLAIIESHGGTLAVECPPEGGSRFVLTLPCGIFDEAPSDTAIASGARFGPLSILVVDDEAEVRQALAEILIAAGHAVQTASSGREAIALLDGASIDLIVTDVHIPDFDGRTLYREVERRWPGLARRMIFVTGDTLTAALRDFATARDCPMIEKPFMPDDVRLVVDRVASRAEASGASA